MQNGMFSYTGLTPKQVYALKDKYHIYLLKSGRASISGRKCQSFDIVDSVTNQISL